MKGGREGRVKGSEGRLKEVQGGEERCMQGGEGRCMQGGRGPGRKAQVSEGR